MPLLHSPGLDRWDDFTCLNSLREVEPSVKFVIEDGGLDDFASDLGLPTTAGDAP